MMNQDLVKQHLFLALLGARAEADGYADLSKSLHSQTELRLIAMSDRELNQLASLTASASKTSVDAYQELKARVETIKTNLSGTDSYGELIVTPRK